MQTRPRMRIAVFASPDSWYLRDLSRSRGDRHELVQVPFGNIVARISDPPYAAIAAGPNLQEFDAVLVRTMPPGSLEQVVFRMDCLGRYEAAGGVVINPARAVGGR